MGIVCACIPSLRRFFGQFFQDKSIGSEENTDPESNFRSDTVPKLQPHSDFNLNGRSAFITSISDESTDVEDHFKFKPEAYPTEPIPPALIHVNGNSREEKGGFSFLSFTEDEG
jgi:hypothetical protein